MFLLVFRLIVVVLAFRSVFLLPVGFLVLATLKNLAVFGVVSIVRAVFRTVVLGSALVGTFFLWLLFGPFGCVIVIRGVIIIGVMVVRGTFVQEGFLRFRAFADFYELCLRSSLWVEPMVRHQFLVTLGSFGREDVHHVCLCDLLSGCKSRRQPFEGAIQSGYCTDVLPGCDFFRLPHVEAHVASLLSKNFAWCEERDKSTFNLNKVGRGFASDGLGKLVELV